MKKMLKKLLSVICVMTMTAVLFMGCGKSDQDTPSSPDTDNKPADTGNTGTDTAPTDSAKEENPYEISGKVVIAYPEGETAEIVPVLEAFRAQYPNIEVVDEPFPGSTGGAFNECGIL